MFQSWGYNVELQEFNDTRAEAVRYATVRVQQPDEHFLHSISFLGGQAGLLSGTLVDAGSGLEEDFPDTAEGAVVLIQRGDVLFADMAARAKAHGAIAMLVANNKDGLFRGELTPAAELPAAAIRQQAGEELRAQLDRGPVSVSIDVPQEIHGLNVIARPPAGSCRMLSGAHYDTVPWAPGAVDNASGAALVLELARAAAVAGLSDHCFALFSGEEAGLSGSRHFVAEMSQEEREMLVAYVNYDVVAGGTEIAVVGDQDLAGRAVAHGEEAGESIFYTELPSNASSDHASFARAGMPNVMITVDDLGVLHTEQDTFDFAQQHVQPLQPIADIGFSLIQEVLRPAAP
jgi:aminopeptidase YwaD